MADTKEIIRVLGFIHEYFDNHADEQEPNARKELFRDWSEITLDAITMLKAKEPVEPQEKREGDYRNLYCGACGRGIVGYVGHLTGKRFNVSDYCYKCGRAVKWE